MIYERRAQVDNAETKPAVAMNCEASLDTALGDDQELVSHCKTDSLSPARERLFSHGRPCRHFSLRGSRGSGKEQAPGRSVAYIGGIHREQSSANEK
jgi:hypothetical protein